MSAGIFWPDFMVLPCSRFMVSYVLDLLLIDETCFTLISVMVRLLYYLLWILLLFLYIVTAAELLGTSKQYSILPLEIGSTVQNEGQDQD